MNILLTRLHRSSAVASPVIIAEKLTKKYGDFTAVDNLTVFENVQLAAKGAKDFKQILENLGLWEYRRRLFSRLSGGLKRRVGLAMALVGEPEIVFLGKPTTGLDPEARRETWLYIKRLKSLGTTTVLTTHYMEEAERLSDRVATIVKGRIAAEGKVRELVAKHGGRTSSSSRVSTRRF
ncbi:MAG: ABC transporter ATP-binding protein [Candidatus Caldarchaeum sp.]